MIRAGRLLPGGVFIDEGQHRPLKGFALLPTNDGGNEEVVVYAKEMSLRDISTEVTCAALGRCLNLPIPEPVILFDQSNTPYFGSVDISYPSFTHYINNSADKSVSDKLASWPMLQEASYFDEWIAMDDRHNGNLLYNGDEFYLIDHESAIPQGLASHQSGIDYYSNQLLQIANSLLDRTNDIAVQKSANDARAWSVTKKSSINTLQNELSDRIQEKTKNQLISFLSARIEVLGDILYEQIKPQQTQMNYNAQS
ncbi:TPA: HipA family kinase [Klebsiella aerogenes]|uniref:HipA family kinase n=1 Tax=Klebsiella aerogenes TaxID=548 RepID=UPI00292DF26C|nr:hypothetical protein [Klebsiella aerogenes]